MNSRLVLIVCISLAIFSITTIFRPVVTAQADTLRGALRQKIGDYDVQLSTAPTNPIAGKETSIMIRITSTRDNFPLTDVPLIIRVSKDNVELTRTNPIFISGGHYKYSYMFKTPGVYALDLDLLNHSLEADSEANQQATFEFPVQVSDSFLLSLSSIIESIALLIVVLGIAFFVIKKYRRIFYRINNTNTRKTTSS